MSPLGLGKEGPPGSADLVAGEKDGIERRPGWFRKVPYWLLTQLIVTEVNFMEIRPVSPDEILESWLSDVIIAQFDLL